MKVYVLKGKEVQMYTIGELADALGRESQTVRKWEIAGVIPKTLFRDKAKRRLYPQDIVEGLKAIGVSEEITQGVSFQNTQFKEKAHALFKKVEKELLG